MWVVLKALDLEVKEVLLDMPDTEITNFSRGLPYGRRLSASLQLCGEDAPDQARAVPTPSVCADGHIRAIPCPATRFTGTGASNMLQKTCHPENFAQLQPGNDCLLPALGLSVGIEPPICARDRNSEYWCVPLIF